jgi:polysaccharide deacetylase 2 family uncharacterized protein YibQ
MSAKRAAPARKPKKKKGGGLGRLLRFFALLALAGLLCFIVFLLVRDYHERMVREDLEAILGPLEPAGISYQVGDAKAAEDILSSLQRVQKKSYGLLKLSEPKRTRGKIRTEARVRDDRYAIVLYWLPVEEKPPVVVKPPPPPPAKKAVLAIVIDDMGADVGQAKKFFELSYPITAAIMPFQAHSTEVARLAASMRRVHILHMPMEPKDKDVPGTGKGVLPAGATEAETLKILKAALDNVPDAAGMNNHMGSRATEVPALMGWVMQDLGRRGLFFLDSRTSVETVAAQKAKEAKIPWGARDVFLDNVRTPEAIDEQLRQAVEEAKKKGHAVAIGHPHPETLAALKRWEGRFAREGVVVLPLDAIIK